MLQIEPSWGFARFAGAVNRDNPVQNVAHGAK
jgi:hypothetical protein